MGFAGQLAVFSGFIVLGAVGGALVPLQSRSPTRQVTFLAFAAGVMLGAAFFHMLPEAYEDGGYRALWLVPAGFVTLFLLERFVLTHACEEPPECQEHGHDHGHTMGWAAFLGMSVHTLFDGVALGSAITEGVGLTAFIAITAHKIPSSISLAALLKAENRTVRSVLGFTVVFAFMVPLGALLYFGLAAMIAFERFAPMALAFSAGSFLYIAVSDLIPHINRHAVGRRVAHVVGMVAGLAVMLGLAVALGDHGHG